MQGLRKYHLFIWTLVVKKIKWRVNPEGVGKFIHKRPVPYMGAGNLDRRLKNNPKHLLFILCGSQVVTVQNGGPHLKYIGFTVTDQKNGEGMVTDEKTSRVWWDGVV